MAAANDMDTVVTLNALLVRCVVCGQDATDSRLLPCLHSCCRFCLESVGYSNFTCPRCKFRTNMDAEAAQSMDNFMKKTLQEAASLMEEKYCALCEQFDKTTIGTHICPECNGEVLCEGCLKAHKQLTATRHHTPIPTEKAFYSENSEHIKDMLNSTPNNECPRHRSFLMEYFCKACLELVCSTCVRVSHAGHKCITTEEYYETTQEALTTQLDAVKFLETHISDTLAEEEIKMKISDYEKEELVNQISARSEQLIKVIQKTQSSIVETVDEMYRTQADVGNSTVETIKEIKTSIEDSIAFTETFLLLSPRADLIRQHSWVATHLQRLARRVQDLEIIQRKSWTLDAPTDDRLERDVRLLYGKLILKDVSHEVTTNIPVFGQPTNNGQNHVGEPSEHHYSDAAIPEVLHSGMEAIKLLQKHMNPIHVLGKFVMPDVPSDVRSPNLHPNGVQRRESLLQRDSQEDKSTNTPKLPRKQKMSKINKFLLHNITSGANKSTCYSITHEPSLNANTSTPTAESIKRLEFDDLDSINGITIGYNDDLMVVGAPKQGMPASIKTYNIVKKKSGKIPLQSPLPWDIKTCEKDIYYSDYAQRCVISLRKDGIISNVIPMPADEIIDDYKTLSNVLGLAVKRNGDIFVSSPQTNTVYRCDAEDDTFIPFITKKNDNYFNCPVAICVTPCGDLVVAGTWSHTVHIYNAQGRLKVMYGTLNVKGDQDGQLHCPVGVSCDPCGNIYVADFHNHRVSLLSPTGKLITHLLTAEADGIRNPFCIAISPSGAYMAVRHSKLKIDIYRFSSRHDV